MSYEQMGPPAPRPMMGPPAPGTMAAPEEPLDPQSKWEMMAKMSQNLENGSDSAGGALASAIQNWGMANDWRKQDQAAGGDGGMLGKIMGMFSKGGA